LVDMSKTLVITETELALGFGHEGGSSPAG
jgi:hypothetical protein